MAEPQHPEQDDVLENRSGVEESRETTDMINEDYETVKLEACTSEASQQEGNNESWTTYEISKQNETSVPQSPIITEITPDEEEGPSDALQSVSPIRISVSNPRKAEEISKLGIRSTYTSYCVQSETKLADYPFTKRAVWRRFKDFDALHRLLHESYRGYVIPPLPSKNFFESKRGKETFIKERQMELNKFLTLVAIHPVLFNSEELKLFLGCPEELGSSHEWFKFCEKAKKNSTNGDGSIDLDKPGELVRKEFTGIMKKMGTAFRKDTSGGCHPISETERSLQDMVPQLKQMELVLTSAVEKSLEFGNAFQGVGEEFGLLGRIWVTLSSFEDDYIDVFRITDSVRPSLIQIAQVLQKAGYACVRVQQITNKSITLLRGRMNPLADELAMIPSVLVSLQDRTVALRSMYDAQGDLETTRRALDALTIESSKKLGGTSGFATKSAALSTDIKAMVEELNTRTETYETVTNRNLTELNRIQQARYQNLIDLACNVAKVQQEYCETIALIWVNLADEISRLMENELTTDL